MKNFLLRHKNVLLACLFAAILFGIYHFYPVLNQAVAWGLIWTIGWLIPPASMGFMFIAPWIVAGLLCAAAAIIYWLMGLRNSIVAATAGFSISYFAISLLSSLLNLPSFSQIIAGSLLAYTIFIGAYWLVSRLKFHKRMSLALGVVLLALALYITPLVTAPIDSARAQAKMESTLKQGIGNMNFTPYYPTYSSPVVPASPPELQDYESDYYRNETVTFLLGKVKVKQSTLLSGQEKVMDFTRNCDILTISSAMSWGTAIKRSDIEQSLENPKRCNLVHTTPSGKKVYSQSIGKTPKWFYVQLNQTNLIIEFGDTKDTQFNPDHQDELFKVIDSFEILDKQKLQDGRYK